jgi:hypothetical protein
MKPPVYTRLIVESYCQPHCGGPRKAFDVYEWRNELDGRPCGLLFKIAGRNHYITEEDSTKIVSALLEHGLATVIKAIMSAPTVEDKL